MHRSSFRRALGPILASAVITLAGALVPEGSASACAIMPSSMTDPPTMLTERVLILYDKPSAFEHFIREIRFQRVKARFAFLVPTPSRPEIAKVDDAPFDRLADNFPFKPPPEPESSFSLFGGAAKAMAAGPPPVEVLEVKQVGSFTAFVLAATDGQALDQWLKDNDIQRPDNAVPWLQHFVDLKFFFTAFRYEPQSAAPDGDLMGAETVRLSFKSPEAYYPYLEPVRNEVQPSARDLRVWTISQENLLPVSKRAIPGRPMQWREAWSIGAAYEHDRAKLAGLFSGVASFLPSGEELAVQTFEDYKSSRDGWGDVVLASVGQNPDNPTFQAHEAALVGRAPLHVDPREAGEPPRIDALRVPRTGRGCACEIGAQGPRLGPLTMIAAVLLGLARRRNGRR